MLGSLRELIQHLDNCGLLLRVKKEVDPHFELNAVVRKVQATENLPILFESVKGTRYPVISNTLGNYNIVAKLLGEKRASVAKRWAALSENTVGEELDEFPASNAEYMEIPLEDIPHIVFSEKDAGPYITAGVIAARDLETGVVNLSYHRMQMISGTELRTRLSTSGDLYRVQQQAESLGDPLKIAISIGLPPAIMLAAGMTIEPATSEYDLAARIAGKKHRLRVVDGDLVVADSAEFVIEAEILPDERRSEGPFGEWMDYYVGQTDNHVIAIKRVLARKDAIFYAISAGSSEELVMSAIPIAGSLYKAIRTWVPSICDVTCYPLLQFCVIQLKNPQEGQANRALVAAFGAEMNRLKYGVVVDDDVDIHDYHDVMWAIATRCRPDRDVFVVPAGPSFARDEHKTHWGRLGIIAVKPPKHQRDFERKTVPGLKDINLKDYLVS